MISAGGLGLLPDVPQDEKKRAIFRGPLLCRRWQGQVFCLARLGPRGGRRSDSPLRLARGGGGGDPSPPWAGGGDGSQGHHVACAKPLLKREGGRCLRRAPSRASETASAAQLPPFSFPLINSPASLISRDEMRPREHCPPAPRFGALIILPAGGGEVGDGRAGDARTRTRTHTGPARALTHTPSPARGWPSASRSWGVTRPGQQTPGSVPRMLHQPQVALAAPRHLSNESTRELSFA